MPGASKKGYRHKVNPPRQAERNYPSTMTNHDRHKSRAIYRKQLKELKDGKDRPKESS